MRTAMHVERIEWVDSYYTAGWKNRVADLPDADTITSVGIVVRETKQSVTISTSVSSFENVVDPLTIPKRAITKRTRIKVKL